MVEKLNGEEIKGKIINFLRVKGPSLPVHIAKEVNLNTLFASAFLSELSSEKAIKISNLKVGGSPVYYLEESIGMLENFYSYLGGKEKEAFIQLKENLVLQDSELQPSIRVALRSLKDFAYPMNIKINDIDILFWRYFKINENDSREKIREYLQKRKFTFTSPVAQVIPQKNEVVKEIIREVKPEIVREEKIQEKPLIQIEHKAEEQEKSLVKKKDKIKEDSFFVKNIREKLHHANIEIVEEKEIAKKDFSAIVRIDSGVGKIMFYCVVKEKKSVSDTDLAVCLQKAQGNRLPLLFLCDGSLSKKAEVYLQEWKTLITVKKIKELL
jgi:hypothetical protein